jgi:hypothetical protein
MIIGKISVSKLNNTPNNNYITDLQSQLNNSNKLYKYELNNELDIHNSTNNIKKISITYNTKTNNNSTKNKITKLKTISKREIFFQNIIKNKKKFLLLHKPKKELNNKDNKDTSNFKIDRNVKNKYNFRLLDLITYYDINYKNYKINTNQTILQDAFYNNILYFNLLEFFPNNGYLSCLINNKLENSNNHYVIENNNMYIDILEKNKLSHNGFFNIVNLNPMDINISDYSINCILFNNISNLNFETILFILNNNLDNIKTNVYDIYIEKLDNMILTQLYDILTSINFSNFKSDSYREHWINNN